MRKIYISIFLCLAIIHLCSISVNAMSTGLTTEEKNAEEIEKIISNVDIKVIYSEPPEHSIACFDVNENYIAAGYEHYGENFISIYSQSGEFQYGYTFSTYGTFKLEWDDGGENLIIYFIRSDIALEITPAGDVVSVREISDTSDNDLYYRQLDSNKRVVGEKTYILKNNMGPLNLIAFDYSQITSVSDEGATDIIIDFSNYQTVKYTLGFSITLLAIIVVTVVLVTSVIKNVRRYKNDNSPQKQQSA